MSETNKITIDEWNKQLTESLKTVRQTGKIKIISQDEFIDSIIKDCPVVE